MSIKQKHNPEQNRQAASNELTSEYSAPRYVTNLEEQRVANLLYEPEVIDPYEKSSKLAKLGRSILEKTRLYTPTVEAPRTMESETMRNMVNDDLDRTRDLLRERVLPGVDDIAVDAYLGVRSEDSIIPPFFKNLLEKAREDSGKDLSLLTWASDYANNEQLLNLMQWHDDYLRTLDENPEFNDRIQRIKGQYLDGLTIAKEQGLIHPDVFRDTQPIHDVKVRHASPLSALIADAHAFIGKADKPEIQVRPDYQGSRTLFHEFTHLAGRLTPQFNEGQTDRMAIRIYNAVHDKDDQMSEEGGIYEPQMKMLDALAAFSPDTFSNLEVSRQFAATPHPGMNTANLVGKFDQELGFPLLTTLTLQSQAFMHDTSNSLAGGIVRVEAQQAMRDSVEKALDFLQSQGKDAIPHSIDEFLSFLSSRARDLPDEDIFRFASLAKKMIEIKKPPQNHHQEK
jgi:hypothetical protein